MIYLENLLSTNRGVDSIQLTAVIDTALCVGAGGSSGSLADKPIVRTVDNRLLIPASQLKGRWRHECEKIARGLGWTICQSPAAQKMCPQHADLSKTEFERRDYYFEEDGRHHCLICQIFGNPVIPSRVDFDDLICEEQPENLPQEVIRPGVTINRRRRTAQEEKLFYLETSPANAKLRFSGQVYVQPEAPTCTKALLLAGLHHIHALGGSKSAGLGWLHWEHIEQFAISEEEWQNLLPGGKE